MTQQFARRHLACFERACVSKASALLGQITLAVLVAGASMMVMPENEAYAQRPYISHDPFYQGETARRAFFDSYALTGEVSYRPAEQPGLDEEAGAPSIDPLGLSLRFDYQVARQLDVGAIINASGGRSGRSLSVSWLMLKYYEMVENADYAFRLAIDPASDGLVGFPQMDAALIATVPTRYNVETNLAVGARRVRMGYDRWLRRQQDLSTTTEIDNYVMEARDDAPFDVVRTRVMGWELHAMLSYDFLVDLAGSNLFLTAAAEGGEYELFETPHLGDSAGAMPGSGSASQPGFTTSYQTGVMWLRSGFEFSRPSFQIMPYVSVPVMQWSSEDDQAVRSRISGGLSLMLR